MSTFERCLTLWVALCIVVGVAWGHFALVLLFGFQGQQILAQPVVIASSVSSQAPPWQPLSVFSSRYR